MMSRPKIQQSSCHVDNYQIMLDPTVSYEVCGEPMKFVHNFLRGHNIKLLHICQFIDITSYTFQNST
jgi:hypothetical protein